MNKQLFFKCLTFCLLFFTACQQTPAPPVEPAKPDLATIKAEIQALNNTWFAASNAKDLATILSFYAEDAISMSDDKPMIVGKAAIQNAIEADLAKHKEGEMVTYETLEVFGDNNLVTEVGKTTVKDATGKVVYTGKYMELWQKQQGKWRVIREIYNDDQKEEPTK
jgi:uncharacterized protein (TIGR02246 family)